MMEERIEQTFETGDQAMVSIENVQGNITVEGWDEARVHMIARRTGERARVLFSQEGSRVEIRTEVEPAEPFSLGLVMENRGAGTADNVRITTSQPRIVDNEKGLVIDFTIIGTQVNAADVSPSLNVDLGDVGAGQTAVARWLMTSTLQGEFVEYEATYEHLDGLGDSRLSLIDSVEIHELIHAVRVVYPSDDLRPDFLANDIPDIGGIPETVHGSDASVHPVGLAANPITDGPVTAAHREISLTAAAPVGYMYLRVDDPGGDDFRLVRAVRSDGRVIRLQDNAWTTHRTIRLQGQAPYREHLLHLFDFNSTGAYTLYYEAVTADTILPGEARTKADGDFVEIGAGTGVVVTGVFPDGFYVEAPDRSSGIRVTGSQAAEGDRIVVSGAMATAPNGERVIAADAITKLGTGQIAPCVLTIRSLFGGDFHFDPLSGAGQKGMLGGSGLNPVGLLAQVTGRVTALGTGSFTISESAGVHPVKVQTPVEAPLPALESIVVVTGIVSCEKQATGLLPVVRARRASDIRAETVGPVISDVSVSFITINSARVSWKTDVAGSTEVRLGNSPGAYDRTITADGTALSHVVYAAGLTPATAYYLVVVSRDPVTGITSRSAEITFSTRDWGDVAAAKRTSDGEDIELGALVVTACFDGFFYVQRPDRSGGCHSSPSRRAGSTTFALAMTASFRPGRALANPVALRFRTAYRTTYGTRSEREAGCRLSTCGESPSDTEGPSGRPWMGWIFRWGRERSVRSSAAMGRAKPPRSAS